MQHFRLIGCITHADPAQLDRSICRGLWLLGFRQWRNGKNALHLLKLTVGTTHGFGVAGHVEQRVDVATGQHQRDHNSNHRAGVLGNAQLSVEPAHSRYQQ